MTNVAPASKSSATKHRIVLVDDHPIVRQGLAQLIDDETDLIVCGQATTASEAIEVVAATKPDVAIVDISLEDRSGVELIKDLLAKWPELKVLALSMYDESMYAIRVLRAGGRGYVMKQEVSDKVLTGIRRVLSGQIYLSEKMSTRLLGQYVLNTPADGQTPAAELSDRELEVLTMIGRGLATREIAEKLFLSVKTIEAHKERIKDKLRLQTATELVRYAVQFTLDHATPKRIRRDAD